MVPRIETKKNPIRPHWRFEAPFCLLMEETKTVPLFANYLHLKDWHGDVGMVLSVLVENFEHGKPRKGNKEPKKYLMSVSKAPYGWGGETEWRVSLLSNQVALSDSLTGITADLSSSCARRTRYC